MVFSFLFLTGCNSDLLKDVSLALSQTDNKNNGAGPSPSPIQSPIPSGSPSPVPTDAEGSPVNAATALRIFSKSGKKYVPADFSSMDIELTIDNSAETATGDVKIIFNVPTGGYPYFLLNTSIINASLDGQAVQTFSVTDPEGQNTLISLDAEVSRDTEHILELSYSLGADQVSYRTGGVGFITAMADIASGNFFEDYGPASFEDDQFELSLKIILKGVSNEHRVFTNGTVTAMAPFAWQIDFPPYFTSSSFYLHVTDKSLSVREFTYRGLAKTIPVTVYSEDSASAASGASYVPALFSELEGEYGPFLHDKFIAYISGSGGMEYAGATITSVSALGHELMHSWFGRGVMPDGGRSGWIDEAIASWRDYDYFQSAIPADRSPVELDNQSVYDRFTPYEAYASGRKLLSELDTMFWAGYGGLRPLLAGFFQSYQTRVIGTADLEKYLETVTSTDLGLIFQKYVYGSSQSAAQVYTQSLSNYAQYYLGNHPPALTDAEIKSIR